MNTVAMPEQSTDSRAELDRIERVAIDASTRGPVLFFYASAILWLLVGTILGLVTALKFNAPGFLDAWSFTTFGRVRPAHLTSVIYGWASMAGIGTIIWLMARLCHTRLKNGSLLIIAGCIWNLGLTLGILGIFAGHGTSIEWLELPGYSTPLLFIAYSFIGLWTLLMFINRRPGHVYVTQWYLLAAVLWFPWVYGTAQILLVAHPVQGVVQAAVNWWFAHNIIGLWFTTIGVGTVYYMIPKVLGKPIHSYYLSIIGFWTLAFFYSWNGIHHLIYGPLPAWLQTASIVASVMMIIPVTTVAINHHLTMKGSFGALRYSPTLRFIVFGAMCYTLVSLQGISMAFRTINKASHFTHLTVAHAHLGLYAFFTMVMFGAMYYIVPRLVNWEWPCAKLIKIHFWTTAIGILLMFGALTIAGIQQGIHMNLRTTDFNVIMNSTKPWLWMRSLSGALMMVGHFVFAASFVMILMRLGKNKTTPTLFEEPTRGGNVL